MHSISAQTRPARKESNVPMLKSSLEFTVLIYILCLFAFEFACPISCITWIICLFWPAHQHFNIDPWILLQNWKKCMQNWKKCNVCKTKYLLAIRQYWNLTYIYQKITQPSYLFKNIQNIQVHTNLTKCQYSNSKLNHIETKQNIPNNMYNTIF